MELCPRLEAFKAMKSGAMNSTEAAAVKVIDEIIANMTGAVDSKHRRPKIPEANGLIVGNDSQQALVS